MARKTPMDDARFVTKFINPLGESRWQPTLPNGERAWAHATPMHPWQIKWLTKADSRWYTIRGPRLYRSRARAARVAKRRWVKTTENQWRECPTQTA